MKIQIKRTIAILLLVCFLVSLTATTVIAPEERREGGIGWGYAKGEGHNNAGGNDNPGSNKDGNGWGAKWTYCRECLPE